MGISDLVNRGCTSQLSIRRPSKFWKGIPGLKVLLIFLIIICLLNLLISSYFVCQIQSRKVTLCFACCEKNLHIWNLYGNMESPNAGIKLNPQTLISFYLMLIHTATDMSYCWWHKYVAMFIVKAPLYLLICIPPHISHTHLRTVLQVFSSYESIIFKGFCFSHPCQYCRLECDREYLVAYFL